MISTKGWFGMCAACAMIACGSNHPRSESRNGDPIAAVATTNASAGDGGGVSSETPHTNDATVRDADMPRSNVGSSASERTPDAGTTLVPPDPSRVCTPPCAAGMTCYEGRCYGPARHDNLDELDPESFNVFWDAVRVCREVTFAVVNRPSSPLMLLTNISDLVRSVITEWGQYTCLSARELPPDHASEAEVVLRFARGEHGDGVPGSAFDGPGGILCHAFPDTPTWRNAGLVGQIHCDDEEPWAPLALPIAPPYELRYSLLHEFGHVLGLAHNPDIHDAVMYNYYTLPHALHTDDIAGAQSRCGTPSSCTMPPMNHAPQVTVTPTSADVVVGEAVEVTIACTDPDAGDRCVATQCTDGTQVYQGPSFLVASLDPGRFTLACSGTDSRGATSDLVYLTIVVRDRAPSGPTCGNHTCETGEDCRTCAADCGSCPPPPPPPPPPPECRDNETRPCTTACGSGIERCISQRWSGICDGPQRNACGTCESTRSCTSSCGTGVEQCTSGQWTGCTAQQPNACGTCSDTRTCRTNCGSGNERCVSGSWTICDAPTSCCGDGVCTEDRASCRADCPIVCGDGICDTGESCTTDCGVCRDGDTRACTAPCGPGVERCVSRRWTGTCEGPQRNACGTCESTRPCTSSCGTGTEQCTGSQWAGCTAPQPNSCGTCEPTRACATMCGNGIETCSSGAWVSCTAQQPNTCGACSDTRACTNECGNSGTQQCAGGSWAACNASSCIVCGNGRCESGESCSSCPGDCGACEVCGNGRCAGSESHTSCPQDCNHWPTATIASCPASSYTGDAVTYVCAANDPDSDATTCRWTDEFGGATDACTATARWNTAGTYRVTCTVRDPYGATASATCQTTVTNAAHPETCNGIDDDLDGQTDEDFRDNLDCGTGATNDTSSTACNQGGGPAPFGWTDGDYATSYVTLRLTPWDVDWTLWSHVGDLPPPSSFDPDASVTLPAGLRARLCLIYRRDDGQPYTPSCTNGTAAPLDAGYTGCCTEGEGFLHVRWHIESDGVLNNASGRFYSYIRALSGGSCSTMTLTVDF